MTQAHPQGCACVVIGRPQYIMRLCRHRRRPKGAYMVTQGVPKGGALIYP